METKDVTPTEAHLELARLFQLGAYKTPIETTAQLIAESEARAIQHAMLVEYGNLTQSYKESIARAEKVEGEIAQLYSTLDAIKRGHGELGRYEVLRKRYAGECEKVRVLGDALRAIGRRAPIMASTGEYRRGQLHALQACSEVSSAALAATEQPKTQQP